MDKKPLYLITGGSGFFGVHMAGKLLQEGVAVRLADINDLEEPKLIGRVEFYKGDVRDKDFMLSTCKDVDVVIHAAASLPIQASAEKIKSVNLEGTRTTLEAAHERGVKRYIQISSTAVYGVPRFHPIYETSEIVPLGPYGKSKWEAEGICREFRAKGMHICIIRPKTFLGPERLGVFQILFDWMRRGKKLYVVGPGTNRYQLLAISDLVHAVWLASNSEKSNSEFNIGATEFGTINSDFAVVLDYAKSGARLVYLPAGPAKMILRFLEVTKLSPLVQWQYETMDKDSFVDVSKAMKLLNWKPMKSNAETLLENYKWYEEHWQEFEGKSGLTHRVPWNQKILKLVRFFS